MHKYISYMLDKFCRRHLICRCMYSIYTDDDAGYSRSVV